jgi:hypothetical protein
LVGTPWSLRGAGWLRSPWSSSDPTTIAGDAGMTAFALARALPETYSGSVITPSIPVLQLLAASRVQARLVALDGARTPVRPSRPYQPRTEAAVAGCGQRLLPRTIGGWMSAASLAEASVQHRLMEIADEVVARTVIPASPPSSSSPDAGRRSTRGPARRTGEIEGAYGAGPPAP